MEEVKNKFMTQKRIGGMEFNDSDDNFVRNQSIYGLETLKQ